MKGGPVIVLGAARSGTKLLRGVLAAHPDLGAVPYDINYVWTMGQHRLGHDALDPANLAPDTRDFIRRFVGRFAADAEGRRVVEKTVSNTLRVPFVAAVFPEALFVEIVRDGRDVAASAREQWTARSPGGAAMRKLRTFPLRHAWRYGLDYLGGYLRRLGPGAARVSCWGPRYPGIQADLRERSLLEVCALQWARCVTAGSRGLADVAPARVHRLRYEDLVADPETGIAMVMDFLELRFTDEVRQACRTGVVRRNVGKWRSQLDVREAHLVQETIGSVLAEFGYGS